MYDIDSSKQRGREVERLVIFDMDGTTLDTLGYTIDVMNAALLKKGYRALSDDIYKQLLGAGVNVMAQKLLAIVKPDHGADEEKELVKEIMSNAVRWDDFRSIDMFRQIEELLRWCMENDVQVSVLSNTPHTMVQELCSRNLPEYFKVVLGEGEVKRKPSAEGVEKICRLCDVRRENVLLVGDTLVDYQTAENAGVSFLGVTWGCLNADQWRENGIHDFVEDGVQLKEWAADYFGN